MATPYPDRPMVPTWIRYVCMVFGAGNVVGALASLVHRADVFTLFGGLVIGGAWFAFGWYGGLPLVSTVTDWQPPASSDEVNGMHVRGLRIMRRRNWTAWASSVLGVVVMVSLIPLLLPIGHPEWGLFPVALLIAFVNCRYYLSRCPRCGYGFFALSKKRATFLNPGKACHHCGLALDAYKGQAATDLGGRAE